MPSTNIEKIVNQFRIDKRITVFDISFEETGDSIIVKGLLQSQTLKKSVIKYCKEIFSVPVIDRVNILSNNSQGIVRVSVANIHKDPALNSPLVTQSLMGTIVTIIRSAGDWLFVQLPDGYLGWASESIQILSDEQCEKWCIQPKVITTEMGGWVYSPDDKCQVVSDFVIGNVFTLKKDLGECYEILYPDNRSGYISKSAAVPLKEWINSRVLSEEKIVETARRLTGIPYLWGGTSSKAVDCSGFVKMVYFLNGIELPRDADQQALIGIEVERDPDFFNVKPGDLLFFGRKNNDEAEIPITHVGISLGGKKFMQASGDVHFSSFDINDKEYDSRRTESLLHCRRIIGNENVNQK